MAVPFLDLKVTDSDERAALEAAVARVFEHGRIVMGPEVEQFEAAIAKSCGRRYGIGVGSGTSALYFALRALGIGPGDEVIVTSLSWVATANAIAMCGATPVFADIQDNLQVDPASVERLITEQTRAVLPVHWTGLACEMKPLQAICSERGLLLVEDCAQAFSAEVDGSVVGSFGDAGCFSMNAMKVLAACGDAGMIVTDDADVHERLQYIRHNGAIEKGKYCVEPSLNGRLDTLQAAILLERLQRLPALLERRRSIATAYSEALADVVVVPDSGAKGQHVWYTYTIQTEQRAALQDHLAASGIETKVQHDPVMPEQPAYRDGVRGEFSRARELAAKVLCLPCHEKMRDDDVAEVIAAVQEFYR